MCVVKLAYKYDTLALTLKCALKTAKDNSIKSYEKFYEQARMCIYILVDAKVVTYKEFETVLESFKNIDKAIRKKYFN